MNIEYKIHWKRWNNKYGTTIREDGPAFIYNWGTKQWKEISDHWHREGGPKEIHSNGRKVLDGKNQVEL